MYRPDPSRQTQTRMSERQYGIQPGYAVGVPQVAQQTRGTQLHPPPPPPPPPSNRSPPRKSNQQSIPPRQLAPMTHQQPQSTSIQREPPTYRPAPSAAPPHNHPAALVPNSMQQPDNNRSYPLQDMDSQYRSRMMPPDQHDDPYSDYQTPYDNRSYNPSPPRPFASHHPSNSQSSIAPLVARPEPHPPSPPRHAHLNAPMQGAGAAGFQQEYNPRSSYYHGDGYDDFDPRDIADDGDEGFEEASWHRKQRNSRTGAAAVGAGATAGAATGMLKNFGSRGASGNYDPVSNGNNGEKSEWLRSQSNGKKRLKWIIGSIIVLIIIGAVVGGVIAGVVLNNNSNGSSSSSSGDSGSGYDINSSQVKAVMNNKDLHKVFPGMDYTPLNTQYPACLTDPPSQNDVTLDVAVLSQLTPAIRLYGTDCNQTEMVLTAIDRLQLNDTMKVWLGAYIGTNSTTNTRQLEQLYDVLDNYPTSHFVGVIVGNEVLYEQTSITAAELGEQLNTVRSKLTAKNIQLPVSTSDLGIDWSDNPSLAQDSDIVMANVHPFFGGVIAQDGANWAWSFWHDTDVPLTSSSTGTVGDLTYPKQIISEIGWPSQGGHDCGGPANQSYGCTTDNDGAVANVTNMNIFMNEWICPAMNNGTTYFWLEAFDEAWKNIFDTDDDNWEPHWGLMDVNRQLKPGLKIPDCDGKTVDKPY